MEINKLFLFKTGKLQSLEKTDDGNIPLIYGTTENNGVAKFVSVEDENYIFQPPLITVSYLGTAFVQTIPFTTSVVDKSNIIILEPIKKMSLKELYFYCYQINKNGEFGFHYGRRMNMARLRKLDMVSYTDSFEKIIKPIDIENLKPTINLPNIDGNIDYSNLTSITNIFYVEKAKSRSIDIYDSGDIPFVSNGFMNNGIIGYVTPYEDDVVFDKTCISISAFCEAIVQESQFIARGNGGSGLSALVPKVEMNIGELFQYASYINEMCKWRFSYGRMATKQRINKLMIPSYKVK